MKPAAKHSLTTAFSSSLLLSASLATWACSDTLTENGAVIPTEAINSAPPVEGDVRAEALLAAGAAGAAVSDASSPLEQEASSAERVVSNDAGVIEQGVSDEDAIERNTGSVEPLPTQLRNTDRRGIERDFDPSDIDRLEVEPSAADPLDAAAPLVQILAASGSGCAGQTPVVGSVADDLSSFTIQFDGYTAIQGPASPFARLNCIFAINVETPPGMTYAVTRVPLSGKANLEDEATGRIAVTYFYQGGSETSALADNLAAGVTDWATSGAFAADQVQVAPCGSDPLLLLNTSAVVNGELDGPSSSVSVDPELSVHLELTACP